MVKISAQPGWVTVFAKSLFVLLLLVITISPINQTVLAAGDTPSEQPASSSTPSTTKTSEDYRSGFPVLKYLTTDDQDHSYLCTDKDIEDGKCKKPTSNPIGSFVLQAINFLVLIASSLAFLVVVIAGFMMVVATGNENTSAKAKEILGQAALGLVITLSAYFIISFVQSLLFETAG